MADGTRLAARMWLPANVDSTPAPAILEYIPYRRRDGTRARDDFTYPYLAARGYGCVRVDIRGTGDSEGVILDEYLTQEQDDALEIIAWLAGQAWCNGNVGMMGISWGGFNALQVAARRPRALKAIITLCSTDDRYADDMHYMGGAHLTGNLEWGSTYFSIMARAPDPLVVGERWRTMWMERLEAMTPVFATWLEHQRRDDFWRHGSVCEDMGAITCAVMAVGGWSDGYSNPIFRMLRDLTAPRLGIVGPWGHKYPHLGVPGPAIGFLTEMLRWWDYWLKGVDTGIMQEPMLRAYVQDWINPAAHFDHRPGRWVAETRWPSPSASPVRWYLNNEGLRQSASQALSRSICSPLTVGAAAGEWCAYSLGGVGPELPLDQRQDDSLSLVYDSEPLDSTIDILGAPELELVLQADQPNMQLIARLNDIAPDGQVARVTYGVLNLTHRDGHETPTPLEPGQTYTVRVKLNDIGHRFRRGHRIRVAISTSYWPMVWPSPVLGTLTVSSGSSSLILPTRPASTDTEPVFPPPETNSPTLSTGRVHRKVTYDIASGEQTVEVLRDEGRSLIQAIGVETGFHKILRYRILPDDPTSARAEADYDLVHRHAHGWDTRIKTHTAIACTRTHYIVEADLEAFDGNERIFSRSWTQRIPRDLA